MSALMSSSSGLARGTLTFNPYDGAKQRFFHAFRALLPARYRRDVTTMHTQVTSNLRVQAPIPFDAAKLRLQRDIRDGDVVALLHKGTSTSALVTSQGKNASSDAPATKAQMAAEIRGLRKDLSITQAALAERCGVSQRAVSRWELGLDKPAMKVLNVLADLAVGTERTTFFIREVALGSGVKNFDERVAGLVNLVRSHRKTAPGSRLVGRTLRSSHRDTRLRYHYSRIRLRLGRRGPWTKRM
jgi:transcriptional regulator with XRE-family HTH domain